MYLQLRIRPDINTIAVTVILEILQVYVAISTYIVCGYVKCKDKRHERDQAKLVNIKNFYSIAHICNLSHKHSKYWKKKNDKETNSEETGGPVGSIKELATGICGT